MIKKCISILVASLLLFTTLFNGFSIPVSAANVPTWATSDYGRVSVSGAYITVNGKTDVRFYGVNDTTALQFSIMAYINGDMSVAGRNSVFYGPDTTEEVARIPGSDTPEAFWDQYFALHAYYNNNLVRIGAGDTWGTNLQYQAYTNHRDEYINLLKTMLEMAEKHKVWVVPVFAGIQGEIETEPEIAPYQFGTESAENKEDTVFFPGSDAFNNYISYCNDIMAELEDYDSLGWYDMFNEPDHDKVNVHYWQNDKIAFNTWAKAVAAGTAEASTHPRTMGIAGLGSWGVGLFAGGNEGYWTQSDFDLSTGKVGFEIAHRHFYASATDKYLFEDPHTWAKNSGIDGKGIPLFWGELANNLPYPLERWPFGEQTIFEAGGQAITSMVMNGTPGYPYTGGPLEGPILEIKQTELGNVFQENTAPAAFEIVTQGDAIDWSVYDYWGSRVAGSTETVAGGRITLELPSLETGYYLFKVTASRLGAPLRSASNSFAILPSDEVEPDTGSPFGMSCHFGKSWDISLISLLKKAGVGSVRDELYWDQVERTKGVYEFQDSYQAYMNELNTQQIDPFIIFTYTNQYYDNNATPYTDAGREGFANYGKAVMDEFDQIRWVEVYNEFNYEVFGDRGDGPADSKPEYYFPLLKKTYETIKAEDPDAVVVGGATSGVPFDWLKSLFELGGLDYMDVVSVHPYHYPNAPEILIDEIAKLQKLIRDYNGGADKPIWFTEIGWPTHQSQLFGTSENDQAAYIVRMHVVSIASGIEKIYWYDFMNDGLDQAYNESNFGIVRNTADPLGKFAPKSAYASYSVMTRQLAGADYVSQDDISESIYSYKFNSDGTDTRVIWSTETKNIKVKTEAPLQVTDMMGVKETLYPSLGGYVYLTVSGSPLYLQGDIDEISEGSLFSLSASTVVAGVPIPVILTVNNTLEEPITGSIDIEGSSQSFDVASGDTEQITISVPTGDSSATRTIRGLITVGGQIVAKLQIGTSTVEVIDPVTMQAKHIYMDGQDILRAAVSNNELSPSAYGLESIAWQIGDLSGSTELSINVQPGASEYVDIPVPELPANQTYPYTLTLVVDNGQTVVFTGNIQLMDITDMTEAAYRTVMVDGVLDDLSDVPVIDLAEGELVMSWNHPPEDYTGEEDLGGKLWFTWDDDYVYVSAKISDDVFSQPQSGAMMWVGDCLQFSLSPGLPEEGTPIELHEWNEYGMALTDYGPQLYRFFSSNGQSMGLVDGAQVEIVWDEDAKDITYECAVPWSEIYPSKPGDGLISFTALANDNDGVDRKCYIEWGSGIGGDKDRRLFNPIYMKAAETYTVSFDVEGAITTLEVKLGAQAIRPSDPEKTGYRFTGWYLNGNLYDFNSAVTQDITLTAGFELVSSPPPPTTPTTPAPVVTSVPGKNGEVVVSTSIQSTTDPATGTAEARIGEATVSLLTDEAKKAEAAGSKAVVEIKAATAAGTKTAVVKIPGDAFKKVADTTQAVVKIDVGIGTIAFDAKSVDNISGTASGDISIGIKQADKSTLTDDAKAKIGDRPVYDFSVKAGDTQISSFNGGKVTITIPYSLKSGEKKNSVVVYYIDDKGKLKTVNGKYDEAAGTVVFTVTHFSTYAVGYNEVNFTDVAAKDWYYDAVEFIAARNITSGVDSNRFAPDDKVKRGDFLVLVMNAYGIEADTNITDNFADAGNKYYTAYLGTAKRLGLVAGTGGNKYSPEDAISRQDMFIILYKILAKLDELPAGTSGSNLESFKDSGDIAAGAREALRLFVETGIVSGNPGGNLTPKAPTSRAQVAAVLFNLLSK